MMKKLRSLIHENFNMDLRVKIEILSRRRDLINLEKQEELFKLFREYDIKNIVPLGPGTNRYAFKLNGFVVKVATDHDGKIDNLKEFKMAKRLFPYVTKTYEVSSNGTFLVAEYIQPFASYSEMCKYADRIREILNKLSTVYLIGDVGITSKNYANWGLRIGTEEPVCLDFAYVYDVSSELFVCRNCNDGTMILPNKDFTELYCPNKGCGRRYKFEDIRARIGNDIHRHEIGDLTEEGYLLESSNVLTELDEQRSNYLAKKNKHLETKSKTTEIDVQEEIPFIMEKPPEYYIKEDQSMFNNEKVVKFKFSNGVTIKASAEISEHNDEIKMVPAEAIIESKETETKEINSGESELAFIGSMNNPTSEDKSLGNLLTVSNKPSSLIKEVVATEAVPVVKETPIVRAEAIEKPVAPKVNNKPDTRSKYAIFNDNFLNNQERAISKLSNRIGNHMHELAVFDEVHTHIRDRKMYPETFYKNLQSAIFRSLMIFCNFNEEEVPNQRNKGFHKVFNPPEEIKGTEYEDTMIFIARFWNNRDINSVEESCDIMTAYKKMYNDHIGIQPEWIEILTKRIASKLPIDNNAVTIISNIVKREWCSPEKVIEEVPEEAPVEETIEESMEIVEEVVEEETQQEEVPEEVEENSQTSYDQEEELAFHGNIESIEESLPTSVNKKTMGDLSDYGENKFDSEEDDDDDEDDEEYDNEEIEFLSVEIYPDEDDYDIIKVNTADYFGSISIPFYTKLDEVRNHATPSIADDRNGIWDWLIHIQPDMIFKTKNPDKWLEVNNYEDKLENHLHIVIMGEEDNEYIMGIYSIQGIYVVDDNGTAHPVIDHEIISKINQVVKDDIGYGRISHLKRSLSMKQLFQEESYIESVVEYYDDPENSDNDEYEEGEEMIAENQNEEIESTSTGVEGEASKLAIMGEEAALRAIMGEEQLPYEASRIEAESYDQDDTVVPDEDESMEIVEEEVEEVVTTAQKDPDTPTIFQPIRRKR